MTMNPQYYSSYRSPMLFIGALIFSITVSPYTYTNHDASSSSSSLPPWLLVSASAIAPPTMATRSKKREASGINIMEVVMTASKSKSSSTSTIAATAVKQTTTTAADEIILSTLSNSDDSNDDSDTISTSSSSPESTAAPSSSSNSNPIMQLLTYMRDTAVNFKNGIGQMNTDHRRCNAIRAKQQTYVKTITSSSSSSSSRHRPRGIKGIQTGGITYEEYDFLKKGLIDRNKLFAAVVVSLCLPNYFVYYLWSFPDMMPSPFVNKQRNDILHEISRERCHAVITTLLDIERGARVAPWTSKLNPFGKGATERAMNRLDSYISMGCHHMMMTSSSSSSGSGGGGGASSSRGSNDGGKLLLEKLQPYLYTCHPLTKKQQQTLQLLSSSSSSSETGGGTKKKNPTTVIPFPKQILKGLSKAISADPLNKGASPFGTTPIKHIESVTLADEFIVDHDIDLQSINSILLEEACSARLIGGPGWTDDERRMALKDWLQMTEITPREMVKQLKKNGDGGAGVVVVVEGGGGEDGGGDNNNNNNNNSAVLHYNGNLARAALMCYNAVDATRDRRSDSRLVRAMYQDNN